MLRDTFQRIRALLFLIRLYLRGDLQSSWRRRHTHIFLSKVQDTVAPAAEASCSRDSADCVCATTTDTRVRYAAKQTIRSLIIAVSSNVPARRMATVPQPSPSLARLRPPCKSNSMSLMPDGAIHWDSASTTDHLADEPDWCQAPPVTNDARGMRRSMFTSDGCEPSLTPRSDLAAHGSATLASQQGAFG